jgi:hypothetical protein
MIDIFRQKSEFLVPLQILIHLYQRPSQSFFPFSDYSPEPKPVAACGMFVHESREKKLEIRQ